jgi:Na+-transporting NADH:ubiquinone oxidoreductase subunit C
MKGNESPVRTLAVAGGVAFVCALLVTTAVSLLQPYQQAYASIGRNLAILRAADLIEIGGEVSDRSIVAAYVGLDARLVDLETNTFSDAADAASYDYATALSRPEALIAIPANADIAGIGSKPRLMPIYLSPTTGRVILPFYGRGMWSTISGYLSLERDLDTIAGIAIYSHGETPGIGDRIENADWLASWRGKTVYGADGRVALTIGDATTAAEHRIDAITGATRTVTSVQRSLLFWLGPDGFGPILTALAKETR